MFNIYEANFYNDFELILNSTTMSYANKKSVNCNETIYGF